MNRVLVSGRALQLSNHAVERYQERVRPALEVAQVRDELARLLLGAEHRYERPAWITSDESIPDAWVILTPDIVFPVVNGCMRTCLTRGEVGAQIRIVRQEERRAWNGTRGQRGVKKKHGKVARDARRRARSAREEAMGGE